ncbi:MAG: GspH/FimT family pseudopilin [Rhizomicrobium sp.]
MAPIRPSRIGKSAQAGFTLTELLVVLAIIGLLVVAAPALLKAALPGTQALAAARSLADDLRMARGMAVSRGTTVTVRFDPQRQTYLQSALHGTRVLPNHVIFAFDSPAPHAIAFRADGSSTGGVVLVGSGPQRHRVAADWLTGRITVDE